MTRPKLEHGGTEYVCLDTGDLAHDMANLFAGLDAKQQAEFFAFVEMAADRWDKPQCYQWAAMASEMDVSARRVLTAMFEAATENA